MATHRITRAILLTLAALSLAAAAAADSHRAVLIVFDEDRDFPGLAIINRSLRETFKAELGDDVEFWSESLNLSQFKDPGYDTLLREHFARKYQRKPPDLIVAVMQPSLDFLLRDERVLFPDVPIVFCGIDSSYLERHALPPNVTGVAITRDFAPTLQTALRLQPETRNLFVVGGTSAFDRQVQAIARHDVTPFEKRLNVTYLTDLAMPDLLASVQRLPERSIVLYLTLLSDGAHRAFVPHEALARITAVANAPVYVAVDQYLDLGVVGGHVYSIGTLGRQAAQIGVRVLRGDTPNVPVVQQAIYADIFDWRQLQRWGLDEARLPAGSEIRHRTLSAWDTYKGYIVAAVTVALLQSALIVGLLVSRAQRRNADAATARAEARRGRAEEEALRQREELAHALRLTTLGELAASITHEIGQPLTAILTNAHAVRRLSADGRMSPGELAQALGDIEEDVTRAAETIQRLRTLFRKQHSERTLVDLNAIVEDIVRLLRSEIRVKAVEVEFRPVEPAPVVLGDPVQLRQVILNLLLNAVDAITRTSGGERAIFIEMHRSSADASVAVVIRDTGCGTREEDLERMFERFESTKPNGLGMGLAISRSIVQAHQGRIWATRNDDRGLSLHVELPAAGVADLPAAG